MAKCSRKTRQTAKKMNETLDLYNFKPDDECVKLSFTPNSNMKDKTTVNNTNTSPVKGSINKKTAHIKQSMKSPAYEFFSNKVGKTRRSDSGIFMTPSPILRDITSCEDKSLVTNKDAKKQYVFNSPKEKTNTSILKEAIKNKTSIKMIEKSQVQSHLNKVIKRSSRRNIKDDNVVKGSGCAKETTENMVMVTRNNRIPAKRLSADDFPKVEVVIKRLPAFKDGNSRKKSEPEDNRVAKNEAEKPEVVVELEAMSNIMYCDKLSEEPNHPACEQETIKKKRKMEKSPHEGRKTSSVNSSGNSEVQALSRRPLSSAKLKRNQGCQLRSRRSSTLNTMSSVSQRSVRNTKPDRLASRIQQKAQSKFSIQALVEKSARIELKKKKDKLLSAPTSTPNVVLRPKRKDVIEENIGLKVFSPPKVSPVQRFTSPGGRAHGEVVKSPTSPSDLGSPTLTRATRQSLKALSSPILANGGSKISMPVLGLTRLPSPVLHKSIGNRQVIEIKSNIPHAERRSKRNTKLKSCNEFKNKAEAVPSKEKQGQVISEIEKHPGIKQKHKLGDDISEKQISSSKKIKISSSDNEMPNKENEVRLSINLFVEFSPVKEKIKKKKSAKSGDEKSRSKLSLPKDKENIGHFGSFSSQNEVEELEKKQRFKVVDNDADCSILDINKTYTDSLSRSGHSFKKNKGRYSTSRVEVWAQKKNEEFEDFDNYELSMD